MIQLVANGENLDKPIDGNGRGVVEEKKTDFKLIPLFKPLDPSKLMASKCNPLQYEIEIKKILQCWEHITEGLKIVGDYTKEDMSLAETLNEILSGNLLLWMGFVDSKYSGFVTTRIDRNPNSTTWLSLIHCYIKDGTNPDLCLWSIEQLKEFALKQKCQKIRLWSPRKGWKRKLEPFGFKESYIQYDLDLMGDK